MQQRLPADLPARLRNAGLKVELVTGWETRNRPGDFTPVGVLNHHTGASAVGWSKAREREYADWIFKTGRNDLPAPLCQVLLARDGTVYLGALGRANHAGKAKASGSVAAGDGNRLYVGIEWMLSGYEKIPPAMYLAAVRLNAVLLDVLGSSEQALSCHYQTSVTGKWDIGDPAGIDFKGHKVLDVDTFREGVHAFRNPPKTPTPVKQSRVYRIGHISLQYSDTRKQKKSDLERVFAKGYDELSGTEVGLAPYPFLLKRAARKHGYRVHRNRGNFVAVKRSNIVKGSVKTGNVMLLRKEDYVGAGQDIVLPWLSYEHKTLGRIVHGGSHYPTKGSTPSEPNYAVNKEIAKKIGQWARAHGKGKALVFYGGDQNMQDSRHDTFFGEPLTSCWDERGKWPNTGHGCIDVIASYDHDARVSCKSARVFTDGQLHLNTDHLLIEAQYKINLP